MSTTLQTPPATGLLTAEEFGGRPDPGHPEELERGRVVKMPPPKPRHGFICAEVVFNLRLYLQAHDVGRVFGNDAGVITHRNPDSVRGPDVSFYSYDRFPKAPFENKYPPVAPELIFEVLSPDDRGYRILAKVAEYLEVGVLVVCVLDPDRRTLHLYEGDEPVRILGESDELALPTVLPDFHIQIARLFD